MKVTGKVVLIGAGVLLCGLALANGLEGAQKIAEIKGGSESLWEFLRRFPGSFEAQVFYGLAGSGLLGMIGSWLNKWRLGLADANWWTLKYVVGQIIWLVGASIGAITLVNFQTDSGEFFGWMSVIVTGGFMGFSGEVKTKPNGA